MKKLYVVTISSEILVVADDADDACILAEEAERDADFSYEASSMRHFPNDWNEETVPFGFQDPQNPDKTVKEWMDEGAAPDYKETNRK